MNASAINAQGLNQAVADVSAKNEAQKPSALGLIFKPYGDRPLTATLNGVYTGAKLGAAVGGLLLLGGAVIGVLSRD